MRRNALTVDVEDWYHTNGLDIPVEQWGSCEDRVVGSTRELLELFDRYGAQGTFFVLGCVARQHPELVEEIARRGHEVGSHGGWHRMINRMEPDEFREDIRESKRLLEDISGQKVQMFRAPSWSITPDRYEVLRILTEEGFTVDSSLQPFATPLSGIAGSPIAPFHPQLSADEPPLDLVEFPPTVWQKAGVTMPFSGGFYLRAVPYPLVRWALKQVNREREGMVYLHPWELDANQPRVQASPLIRLAQYYRLRSTKPKVERLLQEFTFVPLGEILEGRTFPATLLTKGVQGPRHG